VERLERTLETHLGQSRPPASAFRKIVAGRKLWNFDKREWRMWQEAL
jgi:hypothetical protein